MYSTKLSEYRRRDGMFNQRDRIPCHHPLLRILPFSLPSSPLYKQLEKIKSSNYTTCIPSYPLQGLRQQHHQQQEQQRQLEQLHQLALKPIWYALQQTDNLKSRNFSKTIFLNYRKFRSE
jgi:hypothetical protein